MLLRDSVAAEMALGRFLAGAATLAVALAISADNSIEVGASPTFCEFYNSTCLKEAAESGGRLDPGSCYGNKSCKGEEQNCYAVWESDGKPWSDEEVGGSQHAHPSGLRVKMMGCIWGNKECEREDDCLERKHRQDISNGHLFCCCRGAMCNAGFRWRPALLPESEQRRPPPPVATEPKAPPKRTSLLIAALVAVVGLLIFLVAVVLFVYRARKVARQQFPAESDLEGPIPGMPPSPQFMKKTVDLLEVQAKGRFGRVWKGMVDNRCVAVKVFPPQEQEIESWKAEQKVYQLPRMNHENILKFIGVDVKGEGLEKEYFLVTEFHNKGSLCDYLKHTTVTWPELYKIALSMVSGLAHLHQELPPRGTLDKKVAVAHRDFKSKNVLLKDDLTACIGDFGLALVLEGPIGEMLGQVGTPRYMAPEVLEGSINFSRDSFLRIDMYACGLVLWELVSRCKMPGIEPGAYKLPFEEEAQHSSLQTMKEIVVTDQKRPRIPDFWKNDDTPMGELSETISHCWDQDPEARRTAYSVVEKLKKLQNTSPVMAAVPPPPYSEGQMNHLNATNGTISEVMDQHELTPFIIPDRQLEPQQLVAEESC